LLNGTGHFYFPFPLQPALEGLIKRPAL